MDVKQLPARPSLEQYKKQAKDLLKAYRAADVETIRRVKKNHPRFEKLSEPGFEITKFALADAQLVIAREYGFESWPKFAKHLQAVARASAFASGAFGGSTLALENPAAAFIENAIRFGTLERAEQILAAYPEIAQSSIHVAAVLGDEVTVRRFIAENAANATAKAAPFDGDALVYLCFSKYLRLDKKRSGAFLRAATALLDAGANPNTGFMSAGDYPDFESALYGAAAVASHPELTRLLLERGADPNDNETPYHAPESYDNAALRVLVESGKLTANSLAMMLVRKADIHDYAGMKYLLEHGADPNRGTMWRMTPLHQTLRRDNDIKNIDAMLDHGGDPSIHSDLEGRSGISLAARRGRSDALTSFQQRGISIELQGVDKLIAACAMNDLEAIRTITTNEPQLIADLKVDGGKLLAEFAGTANTEGVRHLLDLGVSVTALYDGDPYFDIAKDSTALHVAAWKAFPKTVKLLMDRGAPIDTLDAKGRTPLMLAVKACVDSYWTNRRSPESVEALLRAGAAASKVEFPSGYEEVDKLLLQYKK
ncbi:MAG TPA: ankyrin repeat domain-containing protein [Candidatus Angelobacter sp.]|jgi:ankyrin repeat protein